MTNRQALELGDANEMIETARRLAFGSNKYANKDQRQAMADQAGAVAAAEIATHNVVNLPTRNVANAAEQGTVEQSADRAADRGRA